MTIQAVLLLGMVTAAWIQSAPPPAAVDSFPAAHALYASAAYEDALAMLDRLKAQAAEGSVGMRRDIQATRALCLIALGHQDEARAAMEAVVDADPQFEFEPLEAGPRVRAMLNETRARRLSDIIRQRYASARLAYEKQQFDEAVARFDAVRVLLDDPVLEQSNTLPMLGDFRILARDFHALSVQAVAAAAAATESAVGQTSTAASHSVGTSGQAAGTSQAPAVGAGGQVPSAGEANPPPPPTADGRRSGAIVPPLALEQRVPPWSLELGLQPGRTYQATVEVVIDEGGRVTSALIVDSLNPTYDAQLLAHVRSWRYRPGTRDGVPVRFTKLVTVTVEARE